MSPAASHNERSSLWLSALWIVCGSLLFAAATFLSPTMGEEVDDPDLLEARTLIQGGVLLEGARVYRRYLEKNPDDMDARWEYAQLLARLELDFDAVYAAAWIVERDPSHEGARRILNRSLERLEGQLDAEQSLGLLRLVARIHRNQKDFEEAERLYLEYLETFPQDSSVHFELAQMYRDMGREETAMRRLRKAIEANPESYQLRLTEALWTYHRQDNERESKRVLEKLVEDFPESYEGYLHLGHLHRFAERWEDARAHYRKAFELDPTREEAADGFAEVLLQNRAFQRGQRALWSGDPALATSLYQLHFREVQEAERRIRELREQRGTDEWDADSARELRFYENFLDRSPSEIEVRHALADSYLQQERYQEAIRQLRWINQRQPNHWDMRLFTARVMTFDERTLRDAEDELIEIIRYGPESTEAEAAALLGDVRRYLGRDEEAGDAYRLASERDPRFREQQREHERTRQREGQQKRDPLFTGSEIEGTFGFTEDRSASFFHWRLEGIYRQSFSGWLDQAHLTYRYLSYRQNRETIAQEFSESPNKITGHEIEGGVRAILSDKWSLHGKASLLLYNRTRDNWTGQLNAMYGGENLWLNVGGRRREAVFEHYNINALFAGISTNDIFVDFDYRSPTSVWYYRWGIQSGTELGVFSDDNVRFRNITRFLLRPYRDQDHWLDVGIATRYQAYEKVSPYYFSPGSYFGVGPTIHYDHRFAPHSHWGVQSTAYYLPEFDEWDLGFGAYVHYRLSTSTGISVRFDYGESTTPGQSIQTIGGLVTVRHNF